MNQDLYRLIKAEGWEIKHLSGGPKVIAYGQEFTITHPFAIYGKLFKEEQNPTLKYNFMVRMHHMLWPEDIETWNYWSEERFKTYCENWRIMSWASGASTGKSVDGAKIALIEWLCSPKDTAVIVASTTIDSLQSRVYGYLTSYLKKANIKLPYTLLRSAPPKILFDRDDITHSISAIAAAKGKDETAIANYIGRHPKRKLLLILDEGPDLSPVILNALPNLEAGENSFQCIVIGNSSSKFDLHGALSTPKNGWDSIDPLRDSKWETTQTRGICLYFSPYNSPAIHEPDPIKKKRLERFLITREQIEDKKKEYGELSYSFWRMVMGFWREDSTEETVISRKFIDEFDVFQKAEWSGLYPLSIVAGLDPAFSTGGDNCYLRLGILGHTVTGDVVLDFRDQDLLFKIQITSRSADSAEIQIADQVIELMKKYGVPLNHLCVDANGQGRGIAEVIRLQAKSLLMPIKIYGVKGANVSTKSFDIKVVSTYELWFAFREFIQHGQIKGMDYKTVTQLTSRQVIVKGGKRMLEAKKDYKIRMGAIMPSLAHSPDEADSAALCLQSAILNFGFKPGYRKEIDSPQMWHDKYWVYNKMKMQEQAAVAKAPPIPIATFTGNLADIKSGVI